MGAGRPKVKGEKRTAHLGGVHVTPTQLESYKQAAGRVDMRVTDWVVYHLDRAAVATVGQHSADCHINDGRCDTHPDAGTCTCKR